ncbi:MAG: mycofactocin-coupled SDR family oxidoreductase [Gordonia sp. (in: high G+C Gram-positive bacteria)]
MGRMDGKVALITGAGRGQGRAHALRLAEEGADILALDVPEQGTIPYPFATSEDLQETVRQVEALDRRIIAVEGDVREQEQLDALVAAGIEEFGHIDVVVANAATWTVHEFWNMPEDEFKDVLDVNIMGVWRTLKAVTPIMKEQRSGSMVLIASVNGFEGGANYLPYICSKHAVLGMMKSVALELGEYDIRVNAVLPGVVDTKILDWQGGWDLFAGEVGKGKREDMAGARYWPLLESVGMLPVNATSEAVLWLASDDSRWSSGLEMIVDGGHHVMPGVNMHKIAVDNA